MRISDWSSDVCSSDLFDGRADRRAQVVDLLQLAGDLRCIVRQRHLVSGSGDLIHVAPNALQRLTAIQQLFAQFAIDRRGNADVRSEEHTSELQSLMRISYAVFCL